MAPTPSAADLQKTGQVLARAVEAKQRQAGVTSLSNSPGNKIQSVRATYLADNGKIDRNEARAILREALSSGTALSLPAQAMTSIAIPAGQSAPNWMPNPHGS
jgi:hypothetical protein